VFFNPSTILFFLTLILFTSCAEEHISATNEEKEVLNFSEEVQENIDTNLSDKRNRFIENYFQQRHKIKLFNGNILFAEKGQIIAHKSYGMAHFRNKEELTEEHSFQLASVSKTITAIATLQLVEEGILNLNDSIQQFFPNFPYKGMDIHQLLSHRTGMSQYTHFCDRPDSIWPDKTKTISNNDVIDIMEQIVPLQNYPPNKRYYYCNTNYLILASIIEKVTDQKFGDYVKANIFIPSGMTNSCIYDRTNKDELIKPAQGYENRIPWEDVYLNGCVGDKNVYSTTGDLLKFDRALNLNLLINDSLKQMAFSPKNKTFKSNQNYGYGFRLKEHKEYGKIVYHTGWWKGFRSYYIKVIEKDQTIIVLNNVKRGRFFNINELISLLN
tara:strand:- start:1274 stop:2425 length:1152 start_codon:yes stop_codon:yes gene_type:complete